MLDYTTVCFIERRQGASSIIVHARVRLDASWLPHLEHMFLSYIAMFVFRAGTFLFTEKRRVLFRIFVSISCAPEEHDGMYL